MLGINDDKKSITFVEPLRLFRILPLFLPSYQIFQLRKTGTSLPFAFRKPQLVKEYGGEERTATIQLFSQILGI